MGMISYNLSWYNRRNKVGGGDMYSQINNEIYKLKEELRAKEKLQSLRDMANGELRRKKLNRDELYGILKKEEKDVTKLEGMSFSSIFLTMAGKKEDKLDKEREEFLAAKLRYEECLDSIRELEEKIKQLNREIEDYGNIEEKYKSLIKEKERLLVQEDSQEGQNLKESLDRVNQLKLGIKEVKEAIDAGESANVALNKMRKHLDSAKGWGIWDIMGGGLISNMAKHSAIDDANKAAHDFQYLLKSFEKELSDVNEFAEIELNISGFTTFADFFFDGFFVDFFVQSKINDSISKVDNAGSKINDIILNLRRNLNQMEMELKTLEGNINKILEQ